MSYRAVWGRREERLILQVATDGKSERRPGEIIQDLL